MFKVIGKIFNFLLALALGYAICYFGWLPIIVDWFKNFIK